MPRARLILFSLAAAAAVSVAAVTADAQLPGDEDASPDTLRRVIAAQEALIRQMSERIDALEARVESLETTPAGAHPAAVAASGEAAGEGAAGESADARADADARTNAEASAAGESAVVVAAREAEAPALSEAERREQERLVRAAFQQTLIERGGLLLPAGAIDIEPAVSYLHSSADNIVIDGFTILPVLVVGDIVSERVNRELMQVSTTARFGLPWESQLELSLPFSYHQQRRFSADNTERRISGSDLGDFGIGFSRQLTRGNEVWPDLLGSLRYQSDTGTSPFDIDPEESIATGTGFDSLNVAITGVKVVDPVVYFGSVTYTRNFGTDEMLGRYDPGDSTGISLGMAIALNLNSSLSFAYDQRRTKRAHVDGSGVPGSYLTTGVFSVGATFALGDSFTTDLSLGIGTTADSPDVQLQVAFPLRLRR